MEPSDCDVGHGGRLVKGTCFPVSVMMLTQAWAVEVVPGLHPAVPLKKKDINSLKLYDFNHKASEHHIVDVLK